MTDPIEQARYDVKQALAREANHPDTASRTQRRRAWKAYEQAILRYHPDVVRLVEAARRAEWVHGFYEESGHLFWSCPDCGAEADWRGNGRIAGKHEPGCALAAALVPFTTKEESE